MTHADGCDATLYRYGPHLTCPCGSLTLHIKDSDMEFLRALAVRQDAVAISLLPYRLRPAAPEIKAVELAPRRVDIVTSLKAAYRYKLKRYVGDHLIAQKDD